MRLIHQHLGSGESIHKHESCRKGRLLVDASDLGKQEGSNSVHIVRLRVASPGDVHHVGVRFEWELARPIPETTQSIRTSPPSALTILGLLNHFLLVMIRLLLYMRFVFGYYTLHNIIYTALHAPVITTRTPNQVSPLPWCLRVRRPPSSDPVTLESQRLVYCIEHRLHRLSYICQHELSSQNFHAH